MIFFSEDLHPQNVLNFFLPSMIHSQLLTDKLLLTLIVLSLTLTCHAMDGWLGI